MRRLTLIWLPVMLVFIGFSFEGVAQTIKVGVVTPSISYVACEDLAERAVENILNRMEGKVMRAVNPEVAKSGQILRL